MPQQYIDARIPVVATDRILSVVSLPLTEHRLLASGYALAAAPRDQSATYQSGEVQNGYGRCSGAEVTVQIGTSADINVDFTVNAISEQTFNTWHSTASQYFSSEQNHFLDEHYSAGGGLFGGFLGACFGFLCGGGHYDHYVNQRDTFSSAASQQADGFLRSIHNLDNSVLRIQGRLTARGVSYIPVTVTSYIKVTNITFADGKTLRAVDLTNPVAASPQNGTTSGAATDPTTLNIVPTS
jgi:hypothetical protein